MSIFHTDAMEHKHNREMQEIAKLLKKTMQRRVHHHHSYCVVNSFSFSFFQMDLQNNNEQPVPPGV
jgi:hypothetical protein